MTPPDPQTRPSLLARLAATWRYVRSAEPARIQAIWRGVVGVLLAVGVEVAADVDDRVVAGIAAVYVLLALVQGERTRERVYAPATVQQLLADTGAQPVADATAVRALPRQRGYPQR